MRLFGFFGRVAKEAAEEKLAKNALEKKLGRKISTEELYSLSSHLDVSQPDAPQMPLKSTPREASVPFADAKPPMKFTTKLLLIGVPLTLLVVSGVVFFILTMPPKMYNRLNPFAPKPPEGTFPLKLGNYILDDKPFFQESSSYASKNFNSEYKNGSETVRYTLFIYNNEAEVNEAFNKKRGSSFSSDKSKIAENSDTRYAIATLPGWSSYVYFKDGNYLKQIESYRQNAALEFEGLLKNAPPIPSTPLNESELKKSASNTDLSVTVLQLLDDYKKDPTAADTKYKGKTITVSGTVEVSEKDKKGNWMIAFMRPGSTTPKDGMVICGFENSQEPIVSKVKKGDTVKLQGRVFGNILFSLMLEKCSKL